CFTSRATPGAPNTTAAGRRTNPGPTPRPPPEAWAARRRRPDVPTQAGCNMLKKMWPVVAAVAVAAVLVVLGEILWDGLAWDFHPGPDRTDVAREFILASWVKDPDGFAVLKCKQVRRPVLDRVRADYPGFEIVDCTFRHKDGLGNPLTQTHNLWILDGKVI